MFTGVVFLVASIAALFSADGKAFGMTMEGPWVFLAGSLIMTAAGVAFVFIGRRHFRNCRRR